jgi:hypothetical protein
MYYYFVMSLNLDNEEYQVDRKTLLRSLDHMSNDVIQHSTIEYKYPTID